jgi:hypothetical protein
MKPIRFAATAIIAAALVSILCGCSSRSGWGVVLWSIPDADIRSGSVVHVLTESHINNVYIIEGGKAGKRLEVPFWQLKKFGWKSQAEGFAKGFAPYKSLYAIAQRDGLPLRDQPDNAAKRVYKLRDKQTVKILAKAQGQKVTTGDDSLQGDWYQVITDDGTVGYCFSYALSIYDDALGVPPVAVATVQAGIDPDLERLYTTDWRPDYFRDMESSGRIDLDGFGPDFGFFLDRSARTISIKLPQSSVAFGYSDVSRLKEKLYRFEGAQLIVTLRDDGTMMAQYAERGAQKSAFFIPNTADIQSLVDAEKARRMAAFSTLLSKGSDLKSSSYGSLKFLPDGRFSWTGFSALQPAVIPADVSETGRVELRLFLDDSLKKTFDGVMSFAFDGAKPGAFINFYYKRSDLGIQFEYLPDSGLDGNVAVRRSASVVVFFAF